MNNPKLITLSGKTKGALDRNTDNLAKFLQKQEITNLADVAYTLQVGRKPFKYRRFVVSDSVANSAEKLSSPQLKEETFVAKEESRPVIFMFPDHGSHYVNMASELYEKIDSFTKAVKDCFNQLPANTSKKIKGTLYPEGYKVDNNIKEPEIARLVVFIVEYALANCLMSLGIKPYAMIGSGVGEYVAACLADVFSLEEALQLIDNDFKNEIANVNLSEPNIPYISTSTGDWITVEEATDPEYWSDSEQKTVDFSTGLTKLLAEENGLFIEVGAGEELSTYAQQHDKSTQEQTFINLLPSVEKSIANPDHFFDQLGRMWSEGVSIKWEQLYQKKRYRLPLPTYSFDRQEFISDVNPAALQQGLSAAGDFSSGEQSSQLHERTDDIKNYIAPRSEAEEKIMEIFQQIIGLDKISVNEDFFELGGDSLKAVQVTGELHKAFNVEVEVAEIFEHPTVAELAEYIKQADESIYSSISPVEEKEYYPLAAAQRRIFTLNQFDLETTVYNLPMAFIAEGKINFKRFESAVDQVIERHESLRTSFRLIDGQPQQKIHPQSEVEFEVEYEEQETIETEEINNLITEFISPFAFDKPPLMRIKVIKIESEKHVLLFDMHHIISDGTSIQNLVEDLMLAYDQNSAPLELQYKDFAVWQTKLFNSEKIEEQKQYWLDKFSGEIPTLQLPTDYPRPAQQSFAGDRIKFTIGKEFTAKLNKLASETDTTLFMVLLAAYNILLAKYSNQTDIIVGTPTSGRNHPDLQELIGMFINTLPLRNNPQPEKQFNQFLQEIKQNTLEAFANQDYQFDELVEELNLSRNLSRNSLVDTMFILQNVEETSLDVEELNFTPLEIDRDTSQFDLSLECEETNQEIECTFEYCTELFKQETINRMKEHFLVIVDQITTDTAVKLKEINLLTDKELELITEVNSTQKDYGEDLTLRDAFEKQVAQNPDNIAIVFDDQEYTYQQLNNKANQLARVIRNNDTIALMLERSLEMPVSILGSLKSGGAYLPIDPHGPENRAIDIIREAEPEVIITQEKFVDQVNNILAVNGGISQVIFIDSKQSIPLADKEVQSITAQEIEQEEQTNLKIDIKADDPAYIIYTSGSTGKPKGVVVNQTGIFNSIWWRKNKYGFGPADNILVLFPYYFDGFMTSFFTPLLSGSTSVLIKEGEAKDALAIKEYLSTYQISHFIAIPSLYHALLDCCQSKDLVSLEVITLAGEKLTPEVVEKSNQLKPELEIYNEYGPTESSVVTTCYQVTDSNYIPIGQPVDNTRVYIVDDNLQLQPIGVPGELCIAGKGLADRYVNRPQLTADKFVAPTSIEEERIYRTEDRAKWLPDGNIQFLGRVDEQVKLRGYRIELGEIENVILNYELVTEAVVTLREDEQTSSLCAYYVPEEEFLQSELENYLKDILPDYMIPTYLVAMEELPLNSTGKIDKQALPEPEAREREYIAPRNEIESQLAEVWAEELGVEKVGINYNFFEIGGDSLKAITVISKLRNKNILLEINDLFTNPTIRELAKQIIRLEGKQAAAAAEEAEQKDISPQAIEKIEDKLARKYNSRIRIIKCNVEQKIYFVFYIENKSEKTTKLIVNDTSSVVVPDYIRELTSLPEKYSEKRAISIFKQEFSQLLSLQEVDVESKLVEINEILEQGKNSLNQTIVSNKSLYQFPLSAVQKGHLLSEDRSSGNLVKINQLLDKDRLDKACLQLIQREELLRSILVENKDQLCWEVHQVPEDISIPVIDLSAYQEKTKEKIFEAVIKNQFNKKHDESGILYQIFIIKWSLTSNYLAIPIDHAIFDGMSINIIKDKILTYYQQPGTGISQESINLYSNYVEQINKGPQNITTEEIITKYQLEEFNYYKEVVEDFIIKQETEKVKVTDFSLPFDKEIKRENSLKLSFHLFTKALAKHLGITKVPVELINFGRKYENEDYYQTVGEFLDIIPVLVNVDEADITEIVADIQNKIDYAVRHNINFVTLANKEDKINKLIMPQTRNELDIIYNYQGFVTKEEQRIAKLFGIKSDNTISQESKLSSIEGDVFYDSDQLTIRLISTLADYTSTLEKTINELVEDKVKISKPL